MPGALGKGTLTSCVTIDLAVLDGFVSVGRFELGIVVERGDGGERPDDVARLALAGSRLTRFLSRDARMSERDSRDGHPVLSQGSCRRSR